MLDLPTANARRPHTDGGFAQLGDGVGSQAYGRTRLPRHARGYLVHFSDGGASILVPLALGKIAKHT
jgi:hypothetical protein